MVDIRPPVEFKEMGEGHNMLMPFGPHIVYSRMPEKVIKSLNAYHDAKIQQKKDKALDHSEQLVGKVTQEFLIDDEQISRNADFFNTAFGAYHQFYLQRQNKKLKEGVRLGIQYHAAWLVKQYAGEFNPAHIHTECQLSCVGYLKVPDLKKEDEEDPKKHYPCSGNIELFHEGSNYYHVGNIRIRPAVGDFIIFPSYLTHTVYPFKSDEERRSFSMNVSVKVDSGEDKDE
mgnify:FL=1